MGEKSTHSIAELEREISRARVDLLSDVDELQRALRARLDWRRPIRLHPLPLLAGAFALGFLIGWR